jgi:hypothetical protein
MQLIKNKNSWKNYLRIQENRAYLYSKSHSPKSPESYPCIVFTAVYAEDSVRFVHSFVYPQEAKELLKYVRQSNRKEKSSGSRFEDVHGQA